jgi:poly-gamma-glutamate capsule biosynthesis protein CapA/YwtB (metallophosphatase superfamily)
VIGLGLASSGIPPEWAAGSERPGVNLVARSAALAGRVASAIGPWKRPGDIAVASIHWGTNWGYEISPEQRRIAHELVDEGAVDVVHGHSSHHPRGIELRDGHPVLYGCGDFITDYEGIAGQEPYRDDLVLVFDVHVERGSGRIVDLRLIPFQLRRFQLVTPSPADVEWLARTIDRESRALGCRVLPAADGSLSVTPA